MADIPAMLAGLRREHTWKCSYTASEPGCHCGASAHNARVAELAAALREQQGRLILERDTALTRAEAAEAALLTHVHRPLDCSSLEGHVCGAGQVLAAHAATRTPAATGEPHVSD